MVLGLLTEQELLVIGVVEHIWVLGPTSVWSLLLLADEAEGEATHHGDELLRGESLLGEAAHDQTSVVSFRFVLDGVLLADDWLSAHLDNHLWTSTVLNGCVASDLNNVWN